MSTRSPDPVPDKEAQRQQWDSVAAGWKKWWRAIEGGAHVVSERMLDMAGVEPAQRILDIATGIGEPALSAASRVGPPGRVVATDLSPQMLAIARERAASLGLTNVEFLEADAAQLDFPDGSFDAILWRWGVTDLPDPLNTLEAIRRWLAPHGSFATAVWEAGSNARPMASIATAIAQELFDLPSRPGPPPESVRNALGAQMVHAGFTDVRLEEMTMILELPSPEDCAQYLADVSPEFLALLSGKAPGKRAEFRQRLADALQQHTAEDGRVRVHNATICVVGRK